MTGDDIKPASDSESHSMVWSALVFLGLGFLFGWGIGGDNKEKVAIDWAIKTTRQCEVSYRADGHASVADCLQASLDEIEDERTRERQAEDSDPRG